MLPADLAPFGPEFTPRRDNAWIGVSVTSQPKRADEELSDITVRSSVKYVYDAMNLG